MRTSFVTFAAALLTSMGLTTTAGAAELRTTQCSKHRHPEISFQVTSSAIPEEDRQWLVKSLEQMVADGSRFKAGETLQLGWMLNRFEKGPNGTLRLQEPDMKSTPLVFVDSMDATLKTVRSQRDTVESFKQPMQADVPSLRQSIIVPPDYETAAAFAMMRDPPEEQHESGWFMMSGEDQPSEAELAKYQLVSLYEFALRRPDLLHLLALPPGTIIRLPASGRREYFFDEEPLPLTAGSFLDQLDANLARRRGARL